MWQNRDHGTAGKLLVLLKVMEGHDIRIRNNSSRRDPPYALEFHPDEEFAEILCKEKASYTRVDRTHDYGIESPIWNRCKRKYKAGFIVVIFVYDRSDGVIYFASVDTLIRDQAVRPSHNPKVQKTLMMNKHSFLIFEDGLKAEYDDIYRGIAGV